MKTNSASEQGLLGIQQVLGDYDPEVMAMIW